MAGGAIACIGGDLPNALIRAAGLEPVHVVPDRRRATPLVDALGLAVTMGTAARTVLETIAENADAWGGVLLSHADAAAPQVFAALRALPELRLTPDRVFLCDVLRLDRPASLTYSLCRMERLRRWLEAIGTPFDDNELRAAIAVEESRRQDAIAAQARRLAVPGRRILLTGGTQGERWAYDAIAVGGATIVAEDGAAGALARPEAIDPTLPPMTALTQQAMRWPGGAFAGIARYRSDLAALIARVRPDAVLHLSYADDEAAAWTVRPAAELCAETATPLLALHVSDTQAETLAAFAAERPLPPPPPARAPRAVRPVGSPAPRERSRKALASVANFGAYQREWFATVRDQAAAGEPFAIVNANAPQEILRAFDIPFVVNQWWASIVAAKQQSKRYAALLRDHRYPATVEAYSAQGLAAVFDEDAALAPWGGLPRPTMLHAVADSDATRNLFDLWAEATGADLHLYERSIESRWALPDAWWDRLHDDWEATIETERLDLMTADLNRSVKRIEQTTGRTFDRQRFAEVMALVNEQEDYYRRTRDLIAATRPAPASIVDTMPATMVPQWHRGTVWARDAARAFYEEVRARVAAGDAAVAGERLRLMWVGRGLWNDTAFYQRWEASHGAVFVWSMYLGLAADGYIRRCGPGQDPMRALAARFVTMGDELRMPTWAGAWHVKEAWTHGVDAAIAIDDADPLVLRALEAAGVPVLKLSMSNHGDDADIAIDAQVATFLDQLADR
ncbi:hypothetical protein ASG11_05440 [Sphingomonas sp. Leaf357]|uniref:2-hydroxyacyl-CoA dehydratase family protein n=1 Tax=Sphingomonas sp. Leaf357 TaxID=1736350 RepID=UPI0006F8852C|nr:2-hydroxyacyl-CoA dehydratase family protein [Sphingomonas sp. Leaf357]KQS03757.1 hypothetical protein ASG11_05440 [Sphingomonas sp. Leaf357]